MRTKLFKAISALALIASFALLGFFILNMPKAPKANIKERVAPDLSVFFADMSKLNLPENIFISSAKKYEGKYYIADAIAKKVYCIDGNSNILWESKGQDSFILPNRKFPLDISEDGNLWVANTGKFRLEQLDLNTGKFIASWQARDKLKGCCNPVGLVALSGGRFLAMEKGVNLLKLFNPDGSTEILGKLSGNWLDYEVEKENDKIIYCDGLELKYLTLED
ncbi:MAG: hypothetical protein R3Y46_07025 [Opitutales bacterium]